MPAPMPAFASGESRQHRVARRIVASGSGMPILVLTAADRLDDKASGFELGADDYLTKPPAASASPCTCPPRRRSNPPVDPRVVLSP